MITFVVCTQVNQLFDDYICRDTIDLFRNEFLGVVREVKPDPRSVCHMLVSECYKDWNIFERFNWSTPVLPPKIVDNDYVFPTSDVPTLKVTKIPRRESSGLFRFCT